jgi:hypothetical protein
MSDSVHSHVPWQRRARLASTGSPRPFQCRRRLVCARYLKPMRAKCRLESTRLQPPVIQGEKWRVFYCICACGQCWSAQWQFLLLMSALALLQAKNVTLEQDVKETIIQKKPSYDF